MATLGSWQESVSASTRPRGGKNQRPCNQRGVRLRPEEKWVVVPVQLMIDPDLWQAAQEQRA